jgi:hypothetical protein
LLALAAAGAGAWSLDAALAAWLARRALPQAGADARPTSR